MEFWYIIEISFLLNIAYRELKSPKTQKIAKNLLKTQKTSKNANQGTAPTGLFLNYF